MGPRPTGPSAETPAEVLPSGRVERDFIVPSLRELCSCACAVWEPQVLSPTRPRAHLHPLHPLTEGGPEAREAPEWRQSEHVKHLGGRVFQQDVEGGMTLHGGLEMSPPLLLLETQHPHFL